jgi:hypothetical protein
MLTPSLPVWLVLELKHPVLARMYCWLDGLHISRSDCIKALRTRADEMDLEKNAKGGS